MKNPQILTGQQAIDQYGLNALIECRVAVTTELNGLGHSVMQIGVIADPCSCHIDEDDTGVLWVEYEGADDCWYLYSIPADEQFVLLDDKNQPAKTYGAKTPEQIYLIPDAEHGQVWCDTPAPGEGMREEDATRYVREDIYLALQEQVKQLKNVLRQKELIHIGFTNEHQVTYVTEQNSEGMFFPDSDNGCYIPVYMLDVHVYRVGYESFVYCENSRMKSEINELKAQVEQLREDSLVAFGDGFYDGYLHYAKLCGDADFIDDVIRQSELAEAESVYGKQVGSSVRVAEIKAQAARDGFIAGLNARRSIEYDVHNGDWAAADRAADEYADKLRQAAKGE